MSQKHLFTGFVVVVSALLVACGGDVTEITEVNETGMKIIEKGEKLPSCTTENEGTMVYALDSAAAYLCVNRDWTSFNGKDGADGKDGVDGEKGEKGDQGKKGDKGDQGEPGEKGDAGEAGTSCTVEQLPDSSGFKVLCGGDSVGVVLNGEKGDKGEQGDPGEDGKDYNGTEGVLIDARDKQIYRVVTIGTQTWMAENLNYETDSSRCYNDSAKYCVKYGRLYTWTDAMDSAAVFSDDAKGCGYDVECTIKIPARGICPEGWHIPDTTEWKTLYKAVGESLYAMQSKDGVNWIHATDEFGFSALPAGYYIGGVFRNVDYHAGFWSVSENRYSIGQACPLLLKLNYTTFSGECYDKYDGFSVRCVKD